MHGEIRFIPTKEWMKERRKRNILIQKEFSINGMENYQMTLHSIISEFKIENQKSIINRTVVLAFNF